MSHVWLEKSRSAARGGRGAAPAPGFRPASFASPAVIHRASACACGGTCPRCSEPPIHPKLTVSQSHDPLERDADRMADRVLQGTGEAASPAKVGTLSGRGDNLAPPGGRPLEGTARADMEKRFGSSFDAVRVHTGAAAANAASHYNARAYTAGRNIVFGDGQYAPQSASGRRLLAHELAHVVQQAGTVPGAPATPAIQRDEKGDASLSKSRRDAEDKLPAKFPSAGVRVIGTGAADLAGILSSCTGLEVTIASGDMLSVKEPAKAATGTFSTSAKTELKNIAAVKKGIIVDTDPKGLGVEIGAFSDMTPGYQRLDVGNIKVLGAATGVKGGISACDAVMHEMSEAAFARGFSLEKTSNIGPTAFAPAHTEGKRVEGGIRKDFGLSPRSTEDPGSTVILGDENATTKIYLDAMVYGDGKAAKTQLTLYRCNLVAVSKTDAICENEAVASTVVAGVVRFATQMEALKVFNANAAAFGQKPITLPAEPTPKPKKP